MASWSMPVPPPLSDGRTGSTRSQLLGNRREVLRRPTLGRRLADELQVRRRLGHLDAERGGELGDEPEVLLGELQRERDGCPAGIEERRSLVAEVWRAGRAGGDDVVGEGAIDSGRLGEDEAFRQGPVQAVDDG